MRLNRAGWVVSLAMACGSPAALAADLTVFAASSLQGPLDMVAAASGLDIAVAYGGSATLARQIADGAPADVVILASSEWMDWLDSAGLIEAQTRFDVLGNSLVLIATEGSARFELTEAALDRALGDGRLAIGLTEAVPAGIYGRHALQALGLWDGLAGRLAETDNVRVALAMVARAEAPLGLVYRSDALAEAGVTIVADIPAEATPIIRYPAALVSESRSSSGPGFLAFLAGPQAQAIFAGAGFGPPPPQVQHGN